MVVQQQACLLPDCNQTALELFLCTQKTAGFNCPEGCQEGPGMILCNMQVLPNRYHATLRAVESMRPSTHLPRGGWQERLGL